MNYENILDTLSAPQLWERSDAAFWDDEHIAKQMLVAHLDPNMDAASRKSETIEKSVKWLSSILDKNSKILDLGCGPGLYAKKLSDLGYDVTGVDYSRNSIEYAKKQDTKTTYRYQNYLELTDTDEYDAVLMIYCDYAALTEQERRIILHNVSRALKSDGVFIFDVFTDTYLSKLACDNRWYFCENGGFFSDKPHAVLETGYLYENGTVRADRYTIITKDHVTDHIIWNTAYTKDRLLAEFLPAGFKLRTAYDDICGNQYTGLSDTLCLVVEKH